MVPGQTGHRIVRSWSGSGTNETIYETEDGRQWSDDPAKVTMGRNVGGTTGSRVGTIVDGRIHG